MPGNCEDGALTLTKALLGASCPATVLTQLELKCLAQHLSMTTAKNIEVSQSSVDSRISARASMGCGEISSVHVNANHGRETLVLINALWHPLVSATRLGATATVLTLKTARDVTSMQRGIESANVLQRV